MKSSFWRLLAACGALSAWLVLLLAGWTGAGLVHLLLAAAAVLCPWASLRTS